MNVSLEMPTEFDFHFDFDFVNRDSIDLTVIGIEEVGYSRGL